jgi:hypothetical protein
MCQLRYLEIVTAHRKKCKIRILNSGRKENLRSRQRANRLYLLNLANHFTRSGVVAAFERPAPPVALFALLLFESSKKGDAYNILWAVVFGFATLNILSLVAKRFEPNPNRMTFGEVLAIMTVVVAVILLGWEMLYLFKILPIRLGAH